MANEIEACDFLELASTSSTVDVRSPKEYAHGHIPDAVNVPLFSDPERARLGVYYKENGRDQAVLLGLEIVGPKMRRLVEQVRDELTHPRLVIHCWRGGMRSQSLAWLLEQAGMKPLVIRGGYKSYRRAAQAMFAAERRLIVLSGMTGAGKTKLLHKLAESGEQILDLESIANHRGSSFGAIGQPPQPSCEQFENNVFARLLELNSEQSVWVEDESPSIGKVRVPEDFWGTMRRSPAIFIDAPREQRAAYLAREYGALDKQELAEAIKRLERKLGGLRMKQTLSLLASDDFESAAFELLEYYDKTYQHAVEKRPREHLYRLSTPITVQHLKEFAKLCTVSG